MLSHRKIRFCASAVLGVAVALVVAACGSSSGSHHASTHAASPKSKPASTHTPSMSVMVKTAHGSAGTYLVGPNGHALYLFALDKPGKSNCSGACATGWPPLTTSGKPGASGGAMSADIGTITRSGGTKQIIYKGHPLYYFAADTGAGETKGQGINAFGAKWWLVAPSGTAITKSASKKSSSSSSSGGYSY